MYRTGRGTDVLERHKSAEEDELITAPEESHRLYMCDPTNEVVKV
jgi:hypothetical protein